MSPRRIQYQRYGGPERMELAEAIPALVELEQHGRRKGGKLFIAMR